MRLIPGHNKNLTVHLDGEYPQGDTVALLIDVNGDIEIGQTIDYVIDLGTSYVSITDEIRQKIQTTQTIKFMVCKVNYTASYGSLYIDVFLHKKT